MELYAEILTKIKTAVIDDDVDSYKDSSALVSYVNKSLNDETIGKYQRNAYGSVGSVNLICLACKSAAVKVLEYILSEENNICSLPYLTKKGIACIEEEDDNSHNAIYYAIRSNNIEIPEIIFRIWLNGCFEENSDKLDDIISKAFKDLTVRNVYITEEMKMYIKSKLMDLRFFDKTLTRKKNTGNVSDIKTLRDLAILRLDSVLENITYLTTQFFDLEPNEQFLLSSKYVAKNIHILKSSVRCKDRFPWEEIEFCLTIFIRSCQSCYQQYPLYTFVHNKKRLLSHLETFSRILMRLRDKIRTVNKSKLGKLVIDEIKGIEKVADFKELCDDFTQIRDLHSLETIKNCIDLAKSADISEKRDQLVIVRALQVIGECMKNSDDSPNLSADTYELLLSFLPDNMKEVLAQLRNDLSHAEALFLRTEIETSGQKFFKSIQSEINQMSLDVAFFVCAKKAKILHKMLIETMNCKGIDAMKLYLNQNHIFALPLQKEQEEIENLNPGMEQLKQLFLQFERDIDKGLNDSNELIRRIQNIVENVGSKSDAEGSLQSLKSLLPDDLEDSEQICRDFVSLASISMETADAEKCKETLERVFKIGELKVEVDNFQKISLYSNVSIPPEAVSKIRKEIKITSLEKEEIKQFETLVHVLKNYSDRKAIRLKELFLKAYSLIESKEYAFKILKYIMIDSLKKLIVILEFDKERFLYSVEPLRVTFTSKVQKSLSTELFSKNFSCDIFIMYCDIVRELRKDTFAKIGSFIDARNNLDTALRLSLLKNQWTKEFKEILRSHKEQKILKSFKNITDLGDQLENLLSHKLSLIEKYVNDYHLNKLFFEKSPSSSEKLKLVSVIEMLTFDVMTILGCLKDRLANNAFYLDSDYPILNGKNLRNHLAHGNALVSIVLGDDFKDLLLNSDKMKTQNFLKSHLQIGKKIKNDPQRSKVSLNQDLSAINWQQELFLALTEGKMTKVKDCLSKGADMLGRDLRSQTSLHFATKGPSLEIVTFALKFNIDICAVGIDLQTALHIASFHGKLDIVECLIEKLKETNYKKQEINKKDIKGRTPLHLASRNGHKNVVTYLLENGAKSVTRDFLDNVALHYAVIHNHVDVVSIFLEKESMNTTIYGASVLHLASQMGHKNLVETLLEKFNIKLRSDLHFVPLHYAARGGQTDIVEFLIAKDADVNAKILNGITPLHLAARRGHCAVVELLIQHGADLNAADVNGWTSLFLSLKGGFLETSKLLLEKGAIIDSVENALYSPLNLATVFGHLKLAEVLFHKSNACSKISALHSAAFMGHLTIVELFINNGINFEGEDRGCNALHLAAFQGHISIVNFLISKGYDVNETTVRNEDKNPNHGFYWPAATAFIVNSSDIDQFLQIISFSKAQLEDFEATALHLSSSCRHRDIVRSLLKNKANVFIKDGNDSTAFQIIIEEGMSEILVEKNIPDTFTDCGDCLPLHLAAKGGDLLFAKHCIAKGCDVDARSGCLNLTPLHIAVSYGHEEIVSYLIECGANVNAVGGNGATALEIAILENRKNIMRKLIDKNAELISEKEKEYLLSAIFRGHDDMVEYLSNRNPKNGDSMPDSYTSPLDTAVSNGRLNIVKKLIKLQKRKDFAAALCYASVLGHCEIARVLLSNGADPFVSEPYSPLNLAIFQGHSEMVEILIKSGTPITQRDHEGQSVIELAIYSNNLDVLETVLKLLKFDFNIKSPDGSTLLHHASMRGSLQVVEFLVEKGANVNERDSAGAKPIHIAAAKGHKDIVEYFLNEGIDIDDRALEIFSSLLHVAAARDRSEICGFLIKNGLDANIVDGDGRTPLHTAARLGKANALRTLLKHGAFYDSCDERNLRPIDLAIESSLNKNVTNIALLDFIPRLFSSIANNELPRALDLHLEFERLSELDCASIRSARYIPLLHSSALKGCEELAGFLLERSQNPDVRSTNGFTPLHFAALSSSLSIVNALLRKGAMFDAKSNLDITPVELASNRDIIKILNFLNEVFLKVENGDSSVLDDLKNLDEKSAKTVLRARNSSGKTLIAFAVIKEFPKVEFLKSLFQDDVILFLVAGVGLQREKRFEASIKLLDIVLRKRIDIFGTDDPGVMDVLEVIGMNFMYLENYDEGLTIIAKVYSIRKEVLGNCNEYTLNSMFIMATVLKYKGMENEALAMFEDLFEKQSSVLGSDSIETLTTQLKIAYLMHTGETESDKSAKSLSSCLEVLEKLNKIGDGEEIVSPLKLQIAHFLKRAGEPSVALNIFKEFFESCKKLLGLYHSETSDMLFEVASTLYVMSEMEDSLKAFRETLEIRDFILGTNDEKTLDCRFWIANTLLFVGSYYEAYEMFKADLEGRAAVLGASHPKFIQTREAMDFIISRIVNE